MEHESLHLRWARTPKVVEGSDESLGWLVDHLDPLVRAQVRLRLGPRAKNEADVDDVAADVWTVTLTRVGDIRPRAGRFAPVSVAFLGTTAKNLCNAATSGNGVATPSPPNVQLSMAWTPRPMDNPRLILRGRVNHPSLILRNPAIGVARFMQA